jgi:hypothetical protein
MSGTQTTRIDLLIEGVKDFWSLVTGEKHASDSSKNRQYHLYGLYNK